MAKERKKQFFPKLDFTRLQELVDSKNIIVCVFDQKEKRITTQDFAELTIQKKYKHNSIQNFI